MPTLPMHRVLIVDDDEDLTGACRRLLEDSGEFVVSVENDGSRALEVAHRFKPNLVLIDRILPEVDGVRIAEEMIHDSELSEAAIVLITGSVTQKEADSGMFGALPILIKPFWPGAFLGCVRSFLPH